MTRKNIDISRKASAKQIEMLEKAKSIQISNEDEYPGLSEAELREFKRVSACKDPAQKARSKARL